MTATDELRRLLDERGEYYETSGNRTWWGRPIDERTGKPINVFHNQAQPMGNDRLYVELQLATPEQAVEATLGNGTCHMEYRDELSGDELYPTEAYMCSACKYVTVDGKPNYCPNCGRKVVDA